jgi:hypothetical protein
VHGYSYYLKGPLDVAEAEQLRFRYFGPSGYETIYGFDVRCSLSLPGKVE